MAKKTKTVSAKAEKKERAPSQQDLVAAEMKRLGDDFSTKDFAEKSKIPYSNVAWYKWNITANDGVRPAREKVEKKAKPSKKKEIAKE